MSIYDEIRYRVSEGRLTLLQPAMPGTVIVRELFVTKEIITLINGPWPNQESEVNCSYLRADLDRFITGEMISIRMPPLEM